MFLKLNIQYKLLSLSCEKQCLSIHEIVNTHHDSTAEYSRLIDPLTVNWRGILIGNNNCFSHKAIL